MNRFLLKKKIKHSGDSVSLFNRLFEFEYDGILNFDLKVAQYIYILRKIVYCERFPEKNLSKQILKLKLSDKKGV